MGVRNGCGPIETSDILGHHFRKQRGTDCDGH